MISGPVGERERRDRGILTNKLLLSRKGSVCVCVHVRVLMCVHVLYVLYVSICGCVVCVWPIVHFCVHEHVVWVCVRVYAYNPAYISKQAVCVRLRVSVCGCPETSAT